MQTWSDVLGKEKQQEYFQETLNFIRHERESGKIIYPPAADVFNAFKYTEFADVKVVILGQYPYTFSLNCNLTLSSLRILLADFCTKLF